MHLHLQESKWQESYLKNLKVPCAAHLNGEYGVKNLYAGVPVIIGSKELKK